MRRIHLVILFAALFVGLSGIILRNWRNASKPIVSEPILDVNGSDVWVFYYVNGSAEKKEEVQPQHSLRGQLKTLVQSKGGKWMPSVTTFAPNIYFRAKTWTINIQPSLIVVNSGDGDSGYVQLTAPLDMEEYSSIRDAVLIMIEK